jgi:hypothetical protein
MLGDETAISRASVIGSNAAGRVLSYRMVALEKMMF